MTNKAYNGSRASDRFAPIGVFIFNRADHLAQTLESLRQCHGFDESEIYVFADGPRNGADFPAVEKAREVAKMYLGGRAHYRFSDRNKGLAESIIAGVSELTERFGRVIVIEDDLELSSEFLSFMNAALNRYEHDDRVMQVSGYIFPVPEFEGLNEALFFPLTTTWGWATWDRAWKNFDAEATGYSELGSDKALRNEFNLQGAYDYAGMLHKQFKGACDSWGIRWYWSVFKTGGLVCYPPQSFVRNCGMDGTGTHGRGWLKRFRTQGVNLRMVPVSFPVEVSMNCDNWRFVRDAVFRLNGNTLFRSVSKVAELGKTIVGLR